MLANFNQTGYTPFSISPVISSLQRTQGMITSSTSDSIPLENRPSIMATFISLYALIFFFGISGNALVIRKYKFYFHYRK